jgi:hypothetical protein
MKKRLQFDIDPDAFRALELMVAETGAASMAEVVRRALHLLDTYTRAKARGAALVFVDGNGREREIEII